jgi:hypothetical protein
MRLNAEKPLTLLSLALVLCWTSAYAQDAPEGVVLKPDSIYFVAYTSSNEEERTAYLVNQSGSLVTIDSLFFTEPPFAEGHDAWSYIIYHKDRMYWGKYRQVFSMGSWHGEPPIVVAPGDTVRIVIQEVVSWGACSPGSGISCLSMNIVAGDTLLQLHVQTPRTVSVERTELVSACTLEVYPNPARSRVLAHSKCDLTGSQVEVYSMDGRMRTDVGMSLRAGGVLEINTGSLGSGLYMMRVINQKIEVSSKIVILH